jgi:hypothetical protein
MGSRLHCLQDGVVGVALRELEGLSVSIVRVGLQETKGYSEGYEAIFGKKKPGGAKSPAAKKPTARAKKSAGKKAAKKK